MSNDLDRLKIEFDSGSNDPLEAQALRQLRFEVEREQKWASLVNHSLAEGRSARDILLHLWIEQHSAICKARKARLAGQVERKTTLPSSGPHDAHA